MKELFLSSDQTISSSYEFLHDIEMLQAYYLLCREGRSEKIPPVPVMHRVQVEPFFTPMLRRKFDQFIGEHPDAEYFLLDGSHRTTAAALSGHPCPAVIMQSQDDVGAMKAMVTQGRIFKYTLGETIEEVRRNVLTHFEQSQSFQTSAEKIQKMIAAKVIPGYIVEPHGLGGL